MENSQNVTLEERILHAKNGFVMLFFFLLITAAGIAACIAGPVLSESGMLSDGAAVTIFSVGMLIVIAAIIGLCGLKVLNPNEAIVLALFGKYYGTIKKSGFFWVNPFCTAINPVRKSSITVGSGGHTSVSTGVKKISLKTMTLDNAKQKVNDELGNPVEIGAVVIWKVINPTQAVINVENYKNYLSIQCDAIIRNTARKYPYDVNEGEDEKSLRGSSQEIAHIMSLELQEKVENAGIQILDVRITHLAYAPEIASAMLQRQQAAAIIDARQKIVEGAVGMVEMALDKLNENDIVELDEERKAAMVSNLLVVLCGNKDAQPIVNSGTLY
nr:SPFH domain-containing protein [uncultured Sellimonas sp.]